LLKDGELVGAFTPARQEVRPFTDKQIAVVTSFANQAVIAIENARLLNELRQRTTDLTERTIDLTDALEQQTATSDVLKVISSSPGDLQPVFDTMLANATRLCEATHGHVWTFDGEQMDAVAVRGDAPFVKWLEDHNPVRPIPGSAAERIVQGEGVVHVADRREERAYRDNETFRGLVDTSGIRASLSVALRKGDTLLGMINVYRQDVRPFTDNQVKLVEDFAAQAVIAIENARLLNELRESLRQQMATSEVLRVISSSPGALEPVFSVMLEKAAQICDASYGNIYEWDGDALQYMASHNTPEALVRLRKSEPLRPEPASPLQIAIATKSTWHTADLSKDPAYVSRLMPSLVAGVELGRIRAILFVPMLKEDELVGMFSLCRHEARAFTDKQIALVQNFAAQAVIAIENARLLTELRQRTDDLGRSVGELRALGEMSQAVNSTLDLETVLETIVANAVQLSGTEAGAIYVFKISNANFAYVRLTGWTVS
jgi:GAF domain-containing protein